MSTPSRFALSWAASVALVAAIAVMGIGAASSSAYIYLAGPVTSPHRAPSTIERRTLDGSALQSSYIDGPRVESGHQIQVDSDRIYWLDSSAGDCRVGSATLAGEDVRFLATLSSGPCGSLRSMALADGYLYLNTEDGTISRLSTQPPYDIQPDFVRLPQSPYLGEATSLVTGGGWLYWLDDTYHTVGRARLDGTNVEPALFQPNSSRGNPGLLGVAQGYLWWDYGYGTGSIGRAQLDGSHADPSYLTGVQMYDGAVTPAGWLYYTGSACDIRGCVSIDGSVSRIALEPGATPDVLARLGEGVGSSIAVDSLGAGFPNLRIRKNRNGTATALVSTPHPAKVSVHGRRIVGAKARYRGSKVARVAIRPRRAAVRALGRHGSAHVRVRIKYRPRGGLTRSRNQTLILRLGRR